MAARSRSLVQVHHRGHRGVDGILRLIDLASHDGPLEVMLTQMCDEIAAIADADIASVYVVEDDRLVMRGNHGFPESAIGRVSLAVGEGITGLVAECMRPVSAERAAAEAAYKHVDGLGEERFPVFAGIPLISGGAVIGVVVLQRRKKPFATDEVTLATALGAPISLAIERRKATAVRSARLVGTPHGGGVVLGRAGIVPTATAIGSTPFDASSDDDLARDIDRILGRIREDLGRVIKKLADVDDPAIGSTFDRFALAMVDARLRERILAAAREPSGLRGVAKDYARAANRLGNDDGERVAEIEELCALIGLTADARSSARPGGIWLADRVGAVITIAAVARGAAAIVTSDSVSPTAIAIARAAKLPLVSGVPGLFGWARPQDLLAVDGASGTVLVHPAPTEIERLRRERVVD
ncbi:MAG TPA: GAF domain-containing protein [Kofleriaceae bacterium]|nr:GAF domain-containing protein [Kofleriaceae bacterium]